MSSHLCCHSCGSLDVGPSDSEEPEWLEDLRRIPGWNERGTPYEGLMWRGRWDEQFDESELQIAVESFASVQQRTLKGYTNMVAAFKTHIRKGYHKASGAPERNTSRASEGRY